MAGYAYYAFKAPGPRSTKNLYGYHAASAYISPFFPPVQSQLLTDLATPNRRRGWTRQVCALMRWEAGVLVFFQSSFLGVWEWRGQQRILVERGDPEWHGPEKRGIRGAELCEPRAGGGGVGAAARPGGGRVGSSRTVPGEMRCGAYISRFWVHTCSGLPGRPGGASAQRSRSGWESNVIAARAEVDSAWLMWQPEAAIRRRRLEVLQAMTQSGNSNVIFVPVQSDVIGQLGWAGSGGRARSDGGEGRHSTPTYP
ncbi:hypothetical protein B0H14DRAFT_3131707 [Mycena olivaceomarginata]|nr:hypothetical protein B0H14DRAFT_3131707 [Mycena olivaceomarginata]